MSLPPNHTEQAQLDLEAGTLTLTRAHGRLYAKWLAKGSRIPSTTPVPLEDGGAFAGSVCALVENETRAVRAAQQRRSP